MRLLLVDDEQLTLHMLEKILPWAQLGITEIRSCENGLKAFEICEQWQPDMIITDIKMPVCDGMEFVKRLREKGNDVEVIIMSAYTDFDYAKKAMKYNCFEYILKPIDENELQDAVTTIINQLNEKEHMEKVLHWHHNHKQLNSISRFVRYGVDVDAAIEAFGALNFNYTGARVLLASIENETIDEFSHFRLSEDGVIGDLQEEIHKAMQAYVKTIVIDYSDEVLMLLVESVGADTLYQGIDALRACLEKERALKIRVAFSEVLGQVEAFPQLYEQAAILMRYSFFVNETVIGYGFNSKKDDIDKLSLLDKQKSILEYLKKHQLEQAQTVLHSVFEDSAIINPQRLDRIYEFCYEIILMLRHRLDHTLQHSDQLEAIINIDYQTLQGMTHLHRLKSFMIEALHQWMALHESSMASNNDLVNKCIDLLDREYANNLSLDTICEALAVSKTYFCYLFKRDMGMSIWNYLTDLRMQKAVSLLSTTNLKAYEIAEQVGYDNPSYFSKMFKQVYGVSPNQYRKE